MYKHGNSIIGFCVPFVLSIRRNNSVMLRSLSSKPPANYKNEDILLFFKSEVQAILKSLMGFDVNKIFAKRKLGKGLAVPEYKFMTSKEVEEAQEKYRILAEQMIQMPPFVPIREEIDVVISKDPELIGYSDSKYLITDISFGKTDRTRTIVARDPDGTLRKAFWSERRNANQTYFPRPGRQFRVAKMFQPEYLQPILKRGDYKFVLDRACVEYDADDPEYHRVTHAVYDHMEDTQDYGALRFTRHFGPFVFYLTLNKRIDNLLLENLKTDRLADAAALVSLYHIIHPQAQSAVTKLSPGHEIAYIKEYIDKESNMKVALDLALLSYSKQDDNRMATSN